MLKTEILFFTQLELVFAQKNSVLFDFCTNCANNFAHKCAKLVVCDAEPCGILRKCCSALCANNKGYQYPVHKL